MNAKAPTVISLTPCVILLSAEANLAIVPKSAEIIAFARYREAEISIPHAGVMILDGEIHVFTENSRISWDWQHVKRVGEGKKGKQIWPR